MLTPVRVPSCLLPERLHALAPSRCPHGCGQPHSPSVRALHTHRGSVPPSRWETPAAIEEGWTARHRKGSEGVFREWSCGQRGRSTPPAIADGGFVIIAGGRPPLR